MRHLRLQRTTILLALLLPALAGGQAPAAPPATDAETAVRAVNDQRFLAMVKGDVAALERLLADDLTYTHSNGTVETKQQFLASITAKTLEYRAIEAEDVKVSLHGDTAILTGRAAVKVVNGGREMDLSLRFTAVYIREGGQWKLAAWQSTRLG
jgi:uncharacterized protein (TIGR02246 family)